MAKEIVVSLSDFSADIRTDGALIRTIIEMSFGMDGHRTPIFDNGRIGSREENHYSQHYHADMPWSLFWEKPGNDAVDGCAFHHGGTFQASHGCVHLNERDAIWLFGWTGDDPVTLSVRGPYPNAPTRPAVYFLGQEGMLPRVVRSINAALAREGMLGKGVDDLFDDATDASVRAFQAARGLGEDGAVGIRETAPALGVTL